MSFTGVPVGWGEVASLTADAEGTVELRSDPAQIRVV
jgi:hypothetical protein